MAWVLLSLINWGKGERHSSGKKFEQLQFSWNYLFRRRSSKILVQMIESSILTILTKRNFFFVVPKYLFCWFCLSKMAYVWVPFTQYLYFRIRFSFQLWVVSNFKLHYTKNGSKKLYRTLDIAFFVLKWAKSAKMALFRLSITQW